MLQSLEWEPSGSFYQSGGVPLSGTGTNTAQNGAPGPSRTNYSQDISDPTLPPNPRKAVLYRPTVTQFVAVSIYNSLFLCNYTVFYKLRFFDCAFTQYTK